MGQPLNILIIEDSRADFLMVERHLRQQGLAAACSCVDSEEGLQHALDSTNWDLVLSDYCVPKLNFIESFDHIRSRFPDLPVILVSGSIGEEQAVDLLKQGVWDFVIKDNLARLVPAIERSLREVAEKKARLAAEESTRESEGTYRSLFENMLNGFALCRMIFDGDTPRDFIYLSVNDAFEKQTGLKDVVGRRVSEVIPGIRESDPVLFDTYGRVALTGRPEQFETYVEALDQWYWISVYSPAREHFVAVFDVISERKRNEAAREATVELLRICNVSDKLPDLMRDLMHFFQRITGCEAVGVRLREGDGFPYYVTRGFSEEFVLAERNLCAYDRQGELVRDDAGHPALDCMCGNILCDRIDPTKPFFTPHGSFWSSCTSELLASTTDADRQAKTRNRCNGEGYESVALIPLRSRDETYGLFQFNDREKGRFSAQNIALYEDLVDYVAIALAKLKSDEALHESNERFRMIFEHSIDAIMLTMTDGSILAANPEACRVFRMSEREICRAGRAGLVDGSDPRVPPLLEERRRTGRCRGEITMIRGDGSRFPAEISCAVFSDQGGIQKTSLVIRDVTERRNLEKQFLQAQKMEAVGRLAGGVAHDFNNMLNVILGYAELALLRLVPDDPLYRNLQEIRKAGERSAALTRQLLAFARKEDSVPVIINLNAVMADQLKMLARLIGEDIGIEFHPAPGLWNTRIDPSQIDQVLANLAVNARDAIAGTGTVSIETSNVILEDGDILLSDGGAPGEYVLLVFSDTGAGMSAETRERIFEPFFTTKELGKGTGLGLSTVYGVVRQNDGLISVYSEPGMGTTFRIYLPRFGGDAAVQHEATEAVPMTGSETVLLVEDDGQILELVRTMLEENGYQVLAATSPQEACTICEQHPGGIDLLITDVIMPAMNGKELQARIAAMKPGIRTLFMSGYMADIIATRGVIDQGVNFISKPFSMQTLTQKVREVLEG